MTLVGDFVTGQTVPFQRMRAIHASGALQEGVVGATDLQVTQRAAGANMSVDVAAGEAWVRIDTGTNNGLAHVLNDASANVVVSASNGTNPRIDQIVLRYNDASIPTGSGNTPTLEVVTGTATSGATLDNRTGAAALPNDCLRLADLLIPTSSTSVTTANIRDRRPWARGAAVLVVRTSGDLTTASATLAAIDATNLAPRIEFPSATTIARATLSGQIAHSVASSTVTIILTSDGVQVQQPWTFLPPVANSVYGFSITWVFSLPVGSHVIAPYWSTSAATATVKAVAANSLALALEEVPRPNASNT